MIKRGFLFLTVNLLILATISIVINLLGIRPYLHQQGIDYVPLLIFCLIWGFAGSFISLALSRVLAKKMMRVQLISPDTREPELRFVLESTHEACRRAGLQVMPEVGVYQSPDLNAFATGPTRNRSLVAVSSGLLQRLSREELRGVLAHEVSHIANGDMVTMTLIQGIVNSFVLFLSRIIAFVLSQFVNERMRPLVHIVTIIALDILLSILGSIVVFYFSRQREYRADAGAARLSGRESMIAALKKLQSTYQLAAAGRQPSLATMKISGKSTGLGALLASHPPLAERIARLQQS